MEPQTKKAKITDHFRVALKPLDHNLHRNKGLQQQQVTNTNLKQAAGPQQLQQQQQLLLDPQSQSLSHQQQLQPISQLQQVDSIDLKKQVAPRELLPVQAPLQQHQQNIHHQLPIVQLFQQQQQQKQKLSLQQHITQQQQPANKKENIEVITINDDNNDATKLNNKHNNNSKQLIKIPQQSLINLPVKASVKSKEKQQLEKSLNTYTRPPGLKESILDHDETQLNNILAEPHYAWESYQYDREREIELRTSKYLELPELNQQITPRLRARFVDWLVLIQNDFRLDHEPLYMAVKLVDQYLSKKTVLKQNLELLFITSIFVSVKFEYRPDFVTIPELLHEFGDKYHRRQIINYEIDILSTLNFDIRFPLSYSFLRRYGRCTNATMKTLTLARYILETSLLEYDMIDELESKKAAASLLLSNKMLFHEIAWDEAAEFYTGYKEKELEPLAIQLNEIISRPFDRKVGAIKRKYTSEIFLSVATIAPLVIT